MIHIGTFLNICDNSGARKVSCIKICHSKKKFASVGDLILISIKNLRSSKKSTIRVKKGEVCKALILRSKKFSNRNNINFGSISYIENSVVLITKQYKLIGSRILGPLSKNFKTSKFSRLISLTKGLL